MAESTPVALISTRAVSLQLYAKTVSPTFMGEVSMYIVKQLGLISRATTF